MTYHRYTVPFLVQSSLYVRPLVLRGCHYSKKMAHAIFAQSNGGVIDGFCWLIGSGVFSDLHARFDDRLTALIYGMREQMG